MSEIRFAGLEGQFDFRGIIVALGVLFSAFVILSVMNSVVTGVGLPAQLNTSYQNVLTNSGLLLTIGVFALIIAVVGAFMLRAF